MAELATVVCRVSPYLHPSDDLDSCRPHPHDVWFCETLVFLMKFPPWTGIGGPTVRLLFLCVQVEWQCLCNPCWLRGAQRRVCQRLYCPDLIRIVCQSQDAALLHCKSTPLGCVDLCFSMDMGRAPLPAITLAGHRSRGSLDKGQTRTAALATLTQSLRRETGRLFLPTGEVCVTSVSVFVIKMVG